MITKPKKRVNYLNNKDLLKEIHLSKNSYSSFTLPEYHQYDLIIDMPDSGIETSLKYALHEDQIKLAKEKRASRLSIEKGEKVSSDTIEVTDLIFRVMTWEHIPVAAKEVKKNSKNKSVVDLFLADNIDNEDFSDLEDKSTKQEVDDMVHVKVNFPPFQHFKLDETNTFVCVGKSHWIGGMNNGYFSKDHGNITNKLARMYMMLCQKYSMKFNWRGYSYRDEMEASAILQLTYVGLRFNEAKSSNPFAYYTQTMSNAFCRILNGEKRSQNVRDDLLEMNNMSPSFSRQMRDVKSQKPV